MHTVSLTHQLVAIQDDFDLDKIIESGQCFRPQKLADGRYRFLSGSALLYLTPLGDGQYDAAWYGSDREYWADYFDLGRNYAALRCSLAGQSSYLDKSLDFGQGIRILHQDPWEMLITFLISQRKSIPAIRTAVEHLARCCGEPLSAEGDEVFLFPTPQQLCGLSEAQLMGCGLGYRTRYIQNAAAQASSGTLDLGALAALPDDALFSRLLELDGVGKKVANCVCLFGYGRTAMAPIDVWIQRLIDEEFGGRDPFPSYDQQAGIVQQYLFYYKRSTSRSVAHKNKKVIDNSPFGWYNNTRRQGRHTSYGGLAQLGERLHGMQEVSGSIPLFSTIQFVLEPDSLRKRVRVRFLFIGGFAEGLLGTVNEQRQGITMIVVSCLLLCGIKFALCELGRPPIWRVWE